MAKSKKFKSSVIDEACLYSLTYNCDSEELQVDRCNLSTIPLVMDSVTQIVYMNCNGIMTPYLGPNGKPCKFTKNNEIEEIQ